MGDSYLTMYQERLILIVFKRYIQRDWPVPVNLIAKLEAEGLSIGGLTL